MIIISHRTARTLQLLVFFVSLAAIAVGTLAGLEWLPGWLLFATVPLWGFGAGWLLNWDGVNRRLGILVDFRDLEEEEDGW